MKPIKSQFLLPPILLAAFLFSGCYTYYSSLQAQDWPARDAWSDDANGDAVEVPPVVVFLNPFMFTPCAPPVVYPVYDWYHRCWIPESEFDLWLRGPDVTIAFQWGLDWRFSVWSRDWFPVSRWHMDHPHYRGPRYYADRGFDHEWDRRPHQPLRTHPGQQDDRGRWDDRSDDRRHGSGGFSGRDNDPYPDRGQGQERQPDRPPRDRNRTFDRQNPPTDRETTGTVRRTPPQSSPGNLHDTVRRIVVGPVETDRNDGNRPFDKQDPPRDRETTGTVRRTPPQTSPGNLHDTVRRIVVGPVETDRNGAARESNGRENGTGDGNSGSQTRRVKRSEESRESGRSSAGSEKPLTWSGRAPSFEMPSFPGNRNTTRRIEKPVERPAASDRMEQPRMGAGSSRNTESSRTQTEIRKRDSGEQPDRGINPARSENGNPGSRRSRR